MVSSAYTAFSSCLYGCKAFCFSAVCCLCSVFPMFVALSLFAFARLFVVFLVEPFGVNCFLRFRNCIAFVSPDMFLSLLFLFSAVWVRFMFWLVLISFRSSCVSMSGCFAMSFWCGVAPCGLMMCGPPSYHQGIR